MMYTGAHSINFSDGYGANYNTWTTWHLVPLERPSVAPPEVNAIYDGSFKDSLGAVDLSSIQSDITSGMTSRTGSWSFYIENGHGYWLDVYDDIMRKLHGKKLSISLSDDESSLYSYYGRIKVKDYKSDKMYSTVTLEYYLEPYRYSNLITRAYEGETSATFYNYGAFYTPVDVLVESGANFTSFTIQGFANNPITGANTTITINNLLPSFGQITISSTLKKATRLYNGSSINVFNDADPDGPHVYLWSFPLLAPGSNTITWNNGNGSDMVNMTFLYRERYL